MPEIPEHNYAKSWAADTRAEPPLIAGEREILTSFLDYHRETFALKCAGVPKQGLSEKGVPPSGLSLHGLARHLAGVERWWFRIQFTGEDAPMLYHSDADPSQDFDGLDGDPEEDLAVWRAECERSREVVAQAATLDATGIRRRDGARRPAARTNRRRDRTLTTPRRPAARSLRLYSWGVNTPRPRKTEAPVWQRRAKPARTGKVD